MTRFLLAYLAVMCLGTALWGQTPSSITYEGRPGPRSSRADCNNSAGTIQGFSPRNAQTNDLSGDTLYLCLGDTIVVNHAGDENLEGDPNKATPGGIAYAFYTARPTVDGPDLASIQADPSLLKTPPPPNGIWVYKGPSNSGDALFFNGGAARPRAPPPRAARERPWASRGSARARRGTAP